MLRLFPVSARPGMAGGGVMGQMCICQEETRMPVAEACAPASMCAHAPFACLECVEGEDGEIGEAVSQSYELRSLLASLGLVISQGGAAGPPKSRSLASLSELLCLTNAYSFQFPSA